MGKITSLFVKKVINIVDADFNKDVLLRSMGIEPGIVLICKNSAVTNDIQKILGRNAKDFSEYAAETASTGIWNPVN